MVPTSARFAAFVLCTGFGLAAAIAASPAVVINEVMANNRSFTNSSGLAPDWVELHNTSLSPVQLEGMSLSDSVALPRRWVFPTGTVIGADGYLVVQCAGSLPATATNTGFGLKAEGDAIYLFDSPGQGTNRLDGVVFGLQLSDLTLGRAGAGGAWTLTTPTPGAPNRGVPLGDPSTLKINEWMASPSNGSDWFELFNPQARPVALDGLCLTDDLANRSQTPIAALSFLGTGSEGYQVFLADGLATNGANHVGFKLSRQGDSIGLFSRLGALIDSVSFGTQTQDVSEGRLPDGASQIVTFATTPSPGRPNYLPVLEVVINEVLTHTDPPLEDAIELYNPTAAPVDIGGWFLSDVRPDPKRYRIPSGTVLPPHGFRVFYEYEFNPLPGIWPSFELSAWHGNWIVLSAADAAGNLTGASTSVQFSAIENGVSMGRYETSTGVDFVPLSARTFGVDDPGSLREFRLGKGRTNAQPRVGPVVISEIMYHPASIEPTGQGSNPDWEFVELQNLTGNVVPLYLESDPTNGWQLLGGVEFIFPAGAVLAPHGCLLVAGFDPATNQAALASFQARYGVTNRNLILGPFRGRLSDAGEGIELRKAFRTGWSLVFEESIRYSSQTPWPRETDGTGLSLQRIAASAYGNDPINWKADIPTPGHPSLPEPASRDTDLDGLPDPWEWAYGLDLHDSADAAADPDADGMSSLAEYLSGTKPLDAKSCLKLTGGQAGGKFVLHFKDTASSAYTVQYRESLSTGGWTELTNINARGSGQQVEVSDYGASGYPTRLYRLRLNR